MNANIVNTKKYIRISHHAIIRFLEIVPLNIRDEEKVILSLFRRGSIYGAQLGQGFYIFTTEKETNTNLIFACEESQEEVIIKTVLTEEQAMANMQTSIRSVREHFSRK